MGFSRQEYWSGLPFPSPVDHVLSDLTSWDMPFSLSTLLDDVPGATVGPRWVCKHSLAVGCWSACCPGAEAEAPLELPGWGCWEGWKQCWKRPRSRGHPGLFTAVHHIHSFFRFVSQTGHYRVCSGVPCGIQQVLTHYLLSITLCRHCSKCWECDDEKNESLVSWSLHLRAGRQTLNT